MRIAARIGAIGRPALVTLGVAAAALLLFALLAGHMAGGRTRAFDNAVLLFFRNPLDLSDPIGPRWVEEMVRDFTAFGSHGVLLAITAVIVGYLVLVRKRSAALTIAAAVASGMLLSSLLKWGFDRPRPDLVPHGMAVYTQSFPSGHAMLSAVVYLTLGALLARGQADRRVKVFLILVAVVLTIVVGLSRIYLGVHWPTDVLAGWMAGACWALVCWLVMLWLQQRGQVER